MNIFLLLSLPLGLVLAQIVFFGPFRLERVLRSSLPGLILASLLLSFYWLFKDSWLLVWEFPGNLWYWWWGESLAFLLPILGYQYFFSPWKNAPSREREELSLVLGVVFWILNIKDFFLTSALFSDWDLFMLPIIRLGLVVFVPRLFIWFRSSYSSGELVVRGLALLGISLIPGVLGTLHAFHHGIWAWLALILLGSAGAWLQLRNPLRQ